MADLVLKLENGNRIESDGDVYAAGASVTVYAPDGRTLGHWVAREWKDDPESVMGAILACAAKPAVDTGIIWDNVKAALEEEEWQERADGEPGQVRMIYLGTVFNWYPSGKYYTPFANSNVTEEEAEKDEEWREAVEAECEFLGVSFEHGENDPCDLFIAEYRDEPEEESD